MRLLIATPLYPPELGGPATYTTLLEQGLPSCGIEVSIVKFSDTRGHAKGIRHLVYFRNVLREGRHADAILALDPVSVGLPARIAAFLLRKRFIVKIVGDYAWEQGNQRFGITATLDDFVRMKDVPFTVRMLQHVQRFVANTAANVLVPSHYLKGIVEAWGIPAHKIEVIYNAIELESGGSIPLAVEKASRPKVVTVGRLVPWKHIDGVTAAVAMLDDSASLIIVGDGPERENIERHAYSTLGSRAHVVGALSHKDTLAVMKDADVLVLNSSYEGLSHLLIEALMLGKVIIATNVGGNPELITSEENGLLVPTRDTGELTHALKRVIEDSELSARLGARAKVRSKAFTAAVMLNTLKNLLKPV